MALTQKITYIWLLCEFKTASRSVEAINSQPCPHFAPIIFGGITKKGPRTSTQALGRRLVPEAGVEPARV